MSTLTVADLPVSRPRALERRVIRLTEGASPSVQHLRSGSLPNLYSVSIYTHRRSTGRRGPSRFVFQRCSL
jgi:hypothetical protein